LVTLINNFINLFSKLSSSKQFSFKAESFNKQKSLYFSISEWVNLGIYTTLEDKWYDLIDWVDGFVPINPLIDKIDKVFPSFALLIILILLLIIGGLAVVFLNAEQLVDVELTVKSTTGEVLTGAEVVVRLACTSIDSDELTLVTNEEGKAKFQSCLTSAEISVKKDTYTPKKEMIDFSVEVKKTIQLSRATVQSRGFNAKIVDGQNQTLPSAKLSLICTKNGQMVKTEIDKNFSGGQPSTGYAFTIPTDCSLVQLKAMSANYKDSTVTLNNTENNRTIKLEKEILEGEAIFIADSPAGRQEGAVIIYRDEFGREATIIAGIDGVAKKTLAQGEYTYNATAKSFPTNGSFFVEPNKATDVNVYFNDLSLDLEEEYSKDTTKQLFYKIVDNNSPILVGEAKIYKTKGGNTSIFSTMPIKQEGVFGPTPVLDVNNVIYTAIIKSANYETKLVQIEPRFKTDTPQIIQMKKGGYKLGVHVVDDLGKPLDGVKTEIFIFGFEKTFDSALDTDRNGNTTYRALPADTFTVTAKTTLGEGSQNVTINSDTNITLKVVTGSGTIKFNFIGGEERAMPLVKVYKKFNQTDFVKDEEILALKGYVTTKSYKAGTLVKIVIEDANYFPYESLSYEITRSNQEKNIVLTKQNELPNNNETQMILRQVFSANPTNSKETSPPTRIMPGEKYYLLFDLILNREEKTSVVVNFFAGNESKQMIDNNTKVAINFATSLENALVVLSSKMEGFTINPSVDNPYLVDSGAKQLNILFDEAQGLRQIPMILEIKVDDNATGKIELHYQSKFGGYTSLAYKKEFEIGKAFCLGSNCPKFLFSHYLKWGNKPYTPLGEMSERVQIGDEYKLSTIVENASDEAIGAANLLTISDKSGAEYAILFKPDKNSITKPITLAPLSISLPVEVDLSLLKTANDARVKTSVTKIVNGADTQKNAEGNLSTVLFDVKNKNVLQMTLSATSTINVIHEKTFYPLFFVKVVSREGGAGGAKKNVKAIWSARFDGETIPFISGMETDANGNYLGSFDASNIEAGRKIIFEAVDENNSIPAQLIITVGKAFVDIQPKPPECVKVKINGTDISEVDIPTLDVMVGSTNTIVVDSNCDEAKVIWVASDIASTPAAQFNLPAKASQTITLDGTQTVQARSGMLGAYPVQVMMIGSDGYREVGYFDVIMKDPTAPFDLESAIFDFRKTETVSSKITNKKYSGRLDNFYPKMGISTESVSVTYKKPGNPEKISFKALVVGSAVEELIQGMGWGTIWYQSNSGSHCPPTLAANTAPSELYFTEDNATVCEQAIEEVSNLVAEPIEEPEIAATSGEPFYTLPVSAQNKILSEIMAKTGSTSAIKKRDTNLFLSGENIEQKYLKLSFAEGGELNPNVIPHTYSSTSDPVSAEYYPAPIGSAEVVGDGCTKETQMDWVAYERPPGWNDCEYGECWTGGGEKPSGRISLISSEHCNPCKILFVGGKDEAFGIFGKISSRGEHVPCGFLGGNLCHDDSKIKTQPEFYRIFMPKKEVKKVWQLDVNLTTKEGSVESMGSYLDATPIPIWTNIGLFMGHEPGDDWKDGTLRKAVLCSQPMGFIPLTAAGDSEVFGPYPLPDPAETLIEYDTSGYIKYEIPKETIPEGVRVYLKDGQYYAEYIGLPELSSPTIDFNLTKVNLLGQEYAIITVQDWISGTEKQSKIFQVKLIGNPTNCYMSDGTAGMTGKEFVPRLKFDWDWTNISANQCDSSNSEYTYCDGTQFLVSLFKKISNLQDTYLRGNLSDLPKQTLFYSYLIKDNYSQEFLNDFDDYYSTSALTSIGFNTTQSAKGYDQFITENKIKFKVKDGSNIIEGGQLTKGGLYEVTLNAERINKNIWSIFDSNAPNAEITVTFRLLKEAPNYNQFYETPFDGEVGKKGDTYARANYGTSLVNGELKLNNSGSVKARSYTNSFTSVGFTEKKTLEEINDGVVLRYNASPKQLILSASQPNPVFMKVTGAGGAVSGDYTIEGYGAQTTMKKKWTMLSSTLGKGECLDFEKNNNLVFEEKIVGLTRTISWPKATQKGTVGLATTIFTPKVTTASDTTIIKPVNVSMTTLNSFDFLKNGNSLSLTALDSALVMDYDTLQGIFDRIANEEMCMTQNSQNQLMVWWNQDHLNSQLEKVGTDSGHACISD